MSTITLAIAGRTYQIACGEGEEEHIARLGQMIDARVAGHDGMSSQSGERCLLYAALNLADELAESSSKDPAQQAEQDAEGGEDIADAHCANLEALADKLESLAEHLESARVAS